MALLCQAMTEVGRGYPGLSLAEKDPFQSLALIIKHSGFGRKRDTKENHSQSCGSRAGRHGRAGGLESTLNA